MCSWRVAGSCSFRPEAQDPAKHTSKPLAACLRHSLLAEAGWARLIEVLEWPRVQEATVGDLLELVRSCNMYIYGRCSAIPGVK